MTTMYGPKWAPVKQREQRHPFENEFMSRTEHEGLVYPSAVHAYTAA
jgi:RES domain-containing protein